MPQLLVEGGSAARLQSLTALIARIDPDARVYAAPLSRSHDRMLAGARTGGLLASLLGALSLIMASVGIFGVFAYIVQQRTREIGIRVALGARPGHVLGVMFRSTSLALGIGLTAGLVAALVGARLLASSLYGLSTLDPPAYLAVALVLSIAALAASYVPARRAMRVDPTIALRCE